MSNQADTKSIRTISIDTPTPILDNDKILLQDTQTYTILSGSIKLKSSYIDQNPPYFNPSFDSG